MVEIINQVVVGNNLQPLGVFLTGSRALGLNQDTSDGDICILTEDTTQDIRIDDFAKIDIFVRSKKEILDGWFKEYNCNPKISLTQLYTFICYDKLKQEIDEPEVCKNILRATLHFLGFNNYQCKMLAYQYLIYYYMKNNFSMNFDDSIGNLIQRAHDHKLTRKEFLARREEIEAYLDSLDTATTK